MWQLEGEDWQAISARIRREPASIVWSLAAIRLPGQDAKLFTLNVCSGPTAEPKNMDYGRLIISRQLLQPEEAADRLLKATTGPVVGYPDGLRFPRMPDGQKAQAWWLTGGHSWGFGRPVEWPTYFFEWRIPDRDELIWQGRLDDALAKPGLPPYNRAADAIYELVYGTAPSQHPQQLYPQVAVRLADKRARLSSLEMGDAVTRVSVEESVRGSSSGFLLQANWRLPNDNETKHAEQPVARPGSFTFNTTVKPLEFAVHLLAPDGNRVDAKAWRPPAGQPVSVPGMPLSALQRSRIAPRATSDLTTDFAPAESVERRQPSPTKLRRAARRTAKTSKALRNEEPQRSSDPRAVLVIHGRNAKATAALFDYLRALGLRPQEWGQLVKQTGQGSPYIGEVLRVAFQKAQAVVVLFTGDDEAHLLPEFRKKGDPVYESELTPQPRQNVLFEAGMAIGRDESRTIIVEFGERRPFSDISGRHTIQITSTPEWRAALADRLRNAGCDVDQSGNHWLAAGKFPRPPRTRNVSAQSSDQQSGGASLGAPSSKAVEHSQSSVLAVLPREPAVGNAEALSTERQVKERISKLVQTRFGAYPLNDAERQGLQDTLFAAGRDVEIEFDYQMAQSGSGWALRFTPDLGAYGVASDGRKETLERVAEVHNRLLRTIRTWDEWRRLRR